MGGINYLTALLNRHIPQSEYAVVHVLYISYLLYLLIVIFWLIQSEARTWCTLKTIVHAMARSHGDAGSNNSIATVTVGTSLASLMKPHPRVVDDAETAKHHVENGGYFSRIGVWE